MSSGSKKVTTGYRYFMGLHMGLCSGPIDSLLEIRVGDRQAWTGNVTASGSTTINAPELFGGEEREGGVQGTLDVMMGEPTQAANGYLTSKQGSPQPAYRGMVGVVFRQGLIAANNPYIKPWAFRMRRILKGWQADSVWNSAKAAITLPGGVGQAMNPAHIVYECLTNAEWGMGYGSSLIDLASFSAAADVFFAEGLGLCLKWTRQQPIEAFIQTVVDHAGAVFAQDRRTGLFILTPLRGGYDPETLPLFDESNVITIDSYQRAATPEAVNEITVKFEELATGKESAVTVHNLANITAQGAVVTQSKTYPGLPTAELAIRVALRDLRAVSTPLAKVRMRVTRAGYALLPGSLIRLSWPPLGITNLVLRVLRVNTGTPTDSSIELEASEDVFALNSTAYVAQPPIGWQDPNNAPQPAANRVVTEAPLYELNRSLSSAELAALSGDESYLYVVAGKPTSDSFAFEIRTRPGTSGAFQQAATGDFAPTATLAAAIGPGDTAATLTNLSDAELVTTGTYAIIGGTEVVRVDTFNATTGAITLGRGVLDTTAKAHALGAVVYFADLFDNTDGVERVDGEQIEVKLLPRTGRGQLAEGSAPTDSITFDQRPFRPYPPGRLRIGGLTYPTSITGALPAFTWAHRNRLQQNLEGDESGNIGPEAGVTYSIELRNAGTNAVIASQTGITGTSYTPASLPAGAYNVRVQLWSVRGGLESWQRHDYTFAFTAADVFALAAPAVDFVRKVGSTLYAVNLGNKSIRSFNPATGATIATGALLGATADLVRDGVVSATDYYALILEDSTGQYKVKRVSLASLSTVAATSPAFSDVSTIAWDGTHLWVAAGGASVINRLNASTLAIIDTYPITGGPRGVAFDGTDLLVACTASNQVARVAIADGTELARFSVASVPAPTAALRVGSFIFVSSGAKAGVYNATTGAQVAVYDITGRLAQWDAEVVAGVFAGLVGPGLQRPAILIRISDGTQLGEVTLGPDLIGIAGAADGMLFALRGSPYPSGVYITSGHTR